MPDQNKLRDNLVALTECSPVFPGGRRWFDRGGTIRQQNFVHNRVGIVYGCERSGGHQPCISCI
jgi:hypothetical protein